MKLGINQAAVSKDKTCSISFGDGNGTLEIKSKPSTHT
jgi:hypothetical protein